MSRRLGSQVIEATGLVKAYGDKLLFDDLSFRLPPGGIVGVVGANGAGKTTLFRMLVGDEQPDAGSITIGETVDIAYVDQSRAILDDDRTVYEEITDGHDTLRITGLDGAREVNGRAFVASFNFTGADQQKRVGDLAGGERNRVHLAKHAARGLQCAAARRAHQRPRCGHAALAGGGLGARSAAARSSSATTAGSSTGLRRMCWHSKATARCAGSKATSASTRRSVKRELGADANPTRIAYKRLAR